MESIPSVAVPGMAPAPTPTPETPLGQENPAPTPIPTPPPAGGTASTAPKTQEEGPAMVYIEPAFVNVPVGQMFVVSVNIRSAQGVGSVPFHLRYDPQQVEFINYGRVSPFLSQDGAQPFVLATKGNNEIIIGLSREGSKPGVSGAGNLIDLTFRAATAGSSTINFTDLQVLDPAAQRLPFDKQGMTVNVQ